MGVKDNDRLKQGLLLTFVMVGILLIGFTWADGLRGSGSDQLGHVRPSLNRLTPAPADGASLETDSTAPTAGAQDTPLIDHGTPAPSEVPHITPTLVIVDEDQ